MDSQNRATESIPAPAGAQAVRRRPSDRRAEIVRAARGVFLEAGYAGTNLADVAAAGGVSRGLLYRYFPAGRVDLFLGVVDDLAAELHERLRYAASVPFSASRRLEHLLAALFAFFEEEPRAHRLLVRDVWASEEPAVESAAAGVRALLTSEIATLVADPAVDADEVVATSAGILGLALANVELALAGEVGAEVAWQVTCRLATAGLDD